MSSAENAQRVVKVKFQSNLFVRNNKQMGDKTIRTDKNNVGIFINETYCTTEGIYTEQKS